MKKLTKLKIDDIKEGMEKVLKNASSLIEDSELLFNSKKYPRVYALAQLSTEEMAKLPMLFRIGTLIKINGTIDWANFWKRFRKHDKKLLNNLFWFLFISSKSPNINLEAFIKGSVKAISIKNDLKNNSLYVGFISDKFTAPFENIDEHRAKITLELSKVTYKLAESLMSNFIESLGKTEEDILKQFGNIKLSKEDIVEFLNRFEDIILSLINNGITNYSDQSELGN